MSTLLATLVRIVVLAAALAAYYAALPYLFPDDGGGADIGAGLIAFGALVLVSFGWALVDGLWRGVAPTIISWAVVAVILSIGWLVVLAIAEADASMGVVARITQDLDTLPFTMGLVLAPAALGAVIGGAWRPARVET